MNEKNKMEIIKAVIDEKLSKKAAAIKICQTIRNVNLLINKYKKYGYTAFIHKNTGRISNKKIKHQISDQIIDLYINKYEEYNYKHFLEKLWSNHQISVSYTYLINLLKKNNLYSPRIHKVTKKMIKQKITNLLKNENIKKLEKREYLNTLLSIENIHPMQNRKTEFGERLQTDASVHYWVDNEKWYLHGFIDDATGKVLALYFDKEETLMGYYNITKKVLLEYGIPKEIITDKRTVFWSQKEKESDLHSDSLTQYGFLCHNLGIKLTTSSVPQTKGRIERLWNTLQDRLPKELKENNLSDINEANSFLNEYIKRYNSQFSLQLNNIINSFSIFKEHKNIDFYLSRRFERTINKGSTIKYQNKFYLPHSNGEPVFYKNKTKIFVVETFDGQLYSNSFSEWMPLIEVQQNSTYKEAYEDKSVSDIQKTHKQIKTNSPWKYTNWIFYKNSKNKVLGKID
ncbi:ISNCY family transposase [Spiroplasma tabanidicola]|uniref:ISNCY family transposase n=1 Tax=Spiroplasma tabanidicola TaxID=324079 RepID=A0A6I6CD01_9MOLU|nr:ISNCY family transposase [Spiroplasma tabanidicola]QGS52132.1 ISNCY family transposase [Spiroplasma tabanidicola]QGS52168.1 ISNCY family transposase [Spiroplasma tabanidicola]